MVNGVINAYTRWVHPRAGNTEPIRSHRIPGYPATHLSFNRESSFCLSIPFFQTRRYAKMVDPVTAIGLVGNILALVDFSFKLFASAKAIYSSSSDASPDNQVLQLITNDIHTRCQAITKDKNASPQLQILATESLEIAQDLLRLIHKVPSASKSKRSRKLNCFLVALYDVAKKGEIDKLFRRLERLNSQIRSHLQDDLL